MEIRIGIQNVSRELVIETDTPADEVQSAVDAALADGTALRLQDTKGSRVTVPASIIGYVEIGKEKPRAVGFAAGH